MRCVLHKIYELPFKNQVMSYKLGILAVMAFSYLGYLEDEHRQLLWKKVSSQNSQEYACVGVSFLLKLPFMENIFERPLPHNYIYLHFNIL